MKWLIITADKGIWEWKWSSQLNNHALIFSHIYACLSLTSYPQWSESLEQANKHQTVRTLSLCHLPFLRFLKFKICCWCPGTVPECSTRWGSNVSIILWFFKYPASAQCSDGSREGDRGPVPPPIFSSRDIVPVYLSGHWVPVCACFPLVPKHST